MSSVVSQMQTAVNNKQAAVVQTGKHAAAGEYVAFSLARYEFAVAVQFVSEIMGMQQITEVRQAAPEIQGVIDYRDGVIPVIDLRTKLGLLAVDYKPRACIIVLRSGRQSTGALGIVVENILDVFTSGDCELEPNAHTKRPDLTGYFMGGLRSRGKLRLLLDAGSLLREQEAAGLPAFLI